MTTAVMKTMRLLIAALAIITTIAIMPNAHADNITSTECQTLYNTTVQELYAQVESLNNRTKKLESVQQELSTCNAERDQKIIELEKQRVYLQVLNNSDAENEQLRESLNNYTIEYEKAEARYSVITGQLAALTTENTLLKTENKSKLGVIGIFLIAIGAYYMGTRESKDKTFQDSVRRKREESKFYKLRS